MESYVLHGRIPNSFLDAAKERGLNRDVVVGFLDSAPIGWLDGTTEADLIEDLVLVTPELDSGAMRVRVREVGADWELSVVTTDRSGVLATSCRILAGSGLAISGARIASWTDRLVALQRFTVNPVVMPLSGEPDWTTVTLGLRAALLAPQREHDIKELSPLPAGWDLELLEDLADGRLAVRFSAQNVPGLLAEVTQFLSDLGADVRSASVRSDGSLAIDDFVLAFETPAASGRLRSLTKPLSTPQVSRTYWSEWSIEGSTH